MARLVGTGRDPNGQYGAGVVFDVPRDDPHFAELVDNGWAEQVDPHDDPARGTVDIAQAVVRGDALSHPAEQDIADHIGDRAHAIVQKQDPDARHLGDGDDDDVRRRTATVNPDERPYDSKGDAATSSWQDGPQQGDLATHTTLSESEGATPGTPRYPSDAGVEEQLQAEASGETASAGSTATGGEGGGTTGAAGDDGTTTGVVDDADADASNGGDDGATAGARALAEQHGIDLGTVQGTGNDGRVTKADVEQAVRERGGA